MHDTEERTRQAQQTRVDAAQRRAILGWPGAVAVVLVAIVVVLVGGGLAIRALSPGTREPLGVVPTAGPVTNTQVPQGAGSNPVPIAVRTANESVAPTAAPAATFTATTAVVVAGAASPVATAATPAVDAQVVSDVKSAYQRYWDVTAQALRELDASRLGDVATNGELAALQQNIDDLRAQGKAIDTSVEHHVVVNWIQGDKAQVVDRYRDRSVYI
jgi:hypothetical protein